MQWQWSTPIANAGPNQRVQAFQTVSLDGSKSHDKSGFTPLTYQWTQISGPTVSLSSYNIANPAFNAPAFSSNTKLTFELIVTNSKGIQSQPSFVTITVAPPVPHIANAGPNQRVQAFQTVSLDRLGSHDKSGFTPLTYQWT